MNSAKEKAKGIENEQIQCGERRTIIQVDFKANPVEDGRKAVDDGLRAISDQDDELPVVFSQPVK